MLKIKTVKNNLGTDGDSGYFFKSSCDSTVDLERLAVEMTEYNSSFTLADFSGMLTILNSVVLKNLSQGCQVELPFGSLKVNASGTCGSQFESFSLGKDDNSISVSFVPTKECMDSIRSDLVYRQVISEPVRFPKIFEIQSLKDDADILRTQEFRAGGTVRIQGHRLAFDYDDAGQGIFLKKEGSSDAVRIENYLRRGTNIIIFKIPQEFESGIYELTAVTKPLKEYYRTTAAARITVIG